MIPTEARTTTLRIAYFISSYGSGEQLLRLVRTLKLGEPQSPIVIHHDRFSTPITPGLFSGLPDVFVLTSDTPVVWGDITLEAARWRAFRWIRDNLDVDWVVLLSEQDYPISPFPLLRKRLAESNSDAIIYGMNIDEIEDPGLREECIKRYRYQYVSIPSTGIERRLPMRVQRLTQGARMLLFTGITAVQSKLRFYGTPNEMALPTRLGLRAKHGPFSPDFPCWFSDCWYALSSKALDHVLDYLDSHPEFVRYYERTVIPLESATATIIFNDRELEVENSSIQTIRWTNASSGRPDNFGLDDLDYLLKSDGHFARKFGKSESEVLDRLDDIVLYGLRETA